MLLRMIRMKIERVTAYGSLVVGDRRVKSGGHTVNPRPGSSFSWKLASPKSKAVVDSYIG